MRDGSHRIIVGISGASGAIIGIRLLEALRILQVESHLVISPAGQITIEQETDWKLKDVFALANFNYRPDDIGAAISSGSFRTTGMAVAPCSIKTLSAIANCYSANMMSRAADVCLKEGRPLILVVRETPLHTGHLDIMRQAAQAGAIIFPPVPAFYSRPQSLDDIINQTVGRILIRLGIENELYTPWTG